MSVIRGFSAAVIALCVSGAFAETSVPQTISFNQHIRPMLSDKCFACHGLDAKKRKAGLRLDVPEGAYREKDGVRPIVPGHPEQSEVWKRLFSKDPEEVMP